MKTEYATKANERIYEARKKAGLTQEAAAEKLNMKRNTYARMERLGNPNLDDLAKISDLYNVSSDWILFGEEKPEPFAKPMRLAQEINPIANLPFVISPYEIKCLKLLHLVRKKKNRDAVLKFINDIRMAEIEENEKKQNLD